MDNLTDKTREKRGRDSVSTKAAVAILAAVAVAVCAIVVVVLHMAKADNTSTLADASLSDALEATAGVTPVEADGRSATDAQISTTAVFVTDGSDSGKLSALYLIVLNETQSKGYLVSIDPSCEVVVDDASTMTFARLVDEKGVEAAIPNLAEACGLPLEHAAVLDAANWDVVLSALGGGTAQVVEHATELLGSVKSDMGASELTALADEMYGMGLSSFERMDCPVSGGLIDAAALDTAVGAIE